MKAIGVFVVAVILFVVIVPFSFVYTFFKKLTKPKEFFDWFWDMAISIDQTGNVLCSELFNDTMIHDGYKFGNPDETVSGILGKNKRSGSLKRLGLWLDALLEKLDKNHTIKSIEEDEHYE